MILSLRARLIALGVTLIKQPFWIIVPFFIAAALATAAVRHHFFFWDTAQLGAEHALFFYTEGFHQGLLPDAMDSGHPPVFGWYLAGIWHLCGRSLAVSHWAMLPFLWGIIWMAWRLGRRLLGDGFVGIARCGLDFFLFFVFNWDLRRKKIMSEYWYTWAFSHQYAGYDGGNGTVFYRYFMFF